MKIGIEILRRFWFIFCNHCGLGGCFRWMNGLHSKALPMEELIKTVGDQWKSSDIPKESEGIFIEDTYKLLEGGVDVITDAEKSL
uniref:Uncharacterized protein n=1 Tax=Lactuca sativa TaxID=4236 RepID=A0A9R1WWK5_LACSA|nr:hypothetical protein LSAT_V11C800451050 [Lactuca sativa]